LVARSLDLAPGCLGTAHAGPRKRERAGTFELFRDSRGKFRFHLKTADDEIIASSKGYHSKAAAVEGIKSVQMTAPGATVVDKSG
jgi:uncharacterized protein YegP (UPF0339 family)